MTEAKALILAIGGVLVVSLGGLFLLASIGAGIEVLVVIYILALCAGAYTSSSIVMHYGKLKRRREREAILLKPR